MTRKGFTPKGAYVGGSDVYGAGRDEQASKANLADGLRNVDELRRADTLEIERELGQDRADIEEVQTSITSLESAHVVAYARLALVSGAVAPSQIHNLTVSSIGDVLTLKFIDVPREYVVQVTMGDSDPSLSSMAYRVTVRATDFDVEQRAILTDVFEAWPETDYSVHITVVGAF